MTEDQKKLLTTLAKSKEFTYADLSNHLEVPIDRVRNFCRYHKLNIYVKRENSSGEKKLLDFLQRIYKTNRFKTQYSIGERLRIDIYDPKLHIAWEYQGKQHDELINFFHTKEEHQHALNLDDRKIELCIARGIKLIKVYKSDLSYQSIKQIIEKAVSGTGEFSKEAVKTYKERAQEFRKNLYKASRNSEYAKQAKERAKQYRKEQYKKSKEWKKQHEDRKHHRQASKTSDEKIR